MIYEWCGQVRLRSWDEVLFCCTSYLALKVGCTAGCVGEVVSVHNEFICDLDVPCFEGWILTICEQWGIGELHQSHGLNGWDWFNFSGHFLCGPLRSISLLGVEVEVMIRVEVVEVQVGVGVLFGMGPFIHLMGLLLPSELLNLVGEGGGFLLLGLPCLVGLQVLLSLQFMSSLHL